MEALIDLHTFLTLSSQTLIAISGILIITGLVFILKGNRAYHKRCMISASIFALVFVALYLVNSSLFPHTKYTGDYRTLYLFILWSHTLLAVINLPLAIVTVYLGLKEKFEKHKKVAPFTAGVWIYVAITGWAIFFFST